jgi:hypothetical protein
MRRRDKELSKGWGQIATTFRLALLVENKASMNSFVQHIGDPFVNAFAAGGGSSVDLGMDAGRDAQVKPASPCNSSIPLLFE